MNLESARIMVYVDGENWTKTCIRADKKIAKPHEVLTWNRDTYSGMKEFCCPTPGPQPSSRLEQFLAIIDSDVFYWDYFGLQLAYFSHFKPNQYVKLNVLRCHYFATCEGGKIFEYEEKLSALGFSAHVYPRARPEKFYRECKADGVEVINRPKQLDVKLSTVILDDASANNFDICILCANDDDYVPIVDSVKRRGKLVWVVAIREAFMKNARLPIIADAVLDYKHVLMSRRIAYLRTQPGMQEQCREDLNCDDQAER